MYSSVDTIFPYILVSPNIFEKSTPVVDFVVVFGISMRIAAYDMRLRLRQTPNSQQCRLGPRPIGL